MLRYQSPTEEEFQAIQWSHGWGPRRSVDTYIEHVAQDTEGSSVANTSEPVPKHIPFESTRTPLWYSDHGLRLPRGTPLSLTHAPLIRYYASAFIEGEILVLSNLFTSYFDDYLYSLRALAIARGQQPIPYNSRYVTLIRRSVGKSYFGDYQGRLRQIITNNVVALSGDKRPADVIQALDAGSTVGALDMLGDPLTDEEIQAKRTKHE